MDTIEDPQNNHTIGDQGHSWDFHVGCYSSCGVSLFIYFC